MHRIKVRAARASHESINFLGDLIKRLRNSTREKNDSYPLHNLIESINNCNYNAVTFIRQYSVIHRWI